MAKSYGIPMQGSKSRIADKIIDEKGEGASA